MMERWFWLSRRLPFALLIFQRSVVRLNGFYSRLTEKDWPGSPSELVCIIWWCALVNRKDETPYPVTISLINCRRGWFLKEGNGGILRRIGRRGYGESAIWLSSCRRPPIWLIRYFGRMRGGGVKGRFRFEFPRVITSQIQSPLISRPTVSAIW